MCRVTERGHPTSGWGVQLKLQVWERHTPGALKPSVAARLEPKAKALGYLKAKAMSLVFGESTEYFSWR